jgi:endonuclease/exonuclease/phosphatase family metal-dependent hydrolase
LLRLIGAAVEDVATLVASERPDLLFMQEATAQMSALPDLVGGHFHRRSLPGRIHGLAVWSAAPLPKIRILPLPASRMPGRLPRRIAQCVSVGGISFANVHLSHGQWLNRWQLLHIAQALSGPAAIIGDYNAVGPTLLPGFRDVGPREPTHMARKVVPFRLDRCLVRGVDCFASRTLDRGRSDHRPIALALAPAPAEDATVGELPRLWRRFAPQEGGAASP